MEEKRKPRRWSTWLVVGLVLLVAYPLSMGPMVFLTIKGYLPQWMVDRHIYNPLVMLGDHVPWIGKVLVWHCNWWMGR